MMTPSLIKRSLLFAGLSVVLWIFYDQFSHVTIQLTHAILSSSKHAKGWTGWIYELYPRLQVEKLRFNESFFISKVHQLLLRVTWTFQFVITCFAFSPFLLPRFIKTYHKLFDTSISKQYVPYITTLLYTSLLFVVYNAIVEFRGLLYFNAFYNPVGIGKLLLPVFPPLAVLWLIYIVLLTSIAAVIFLPKKWISSSIAALGFIYYQLILFGFGKYDHGFSTLTYALLVYPFFLWEAEKKSIETKTPAWPIVLIQCLIALAYFYCGMEKLFTSGTAWFYSDNLQQHLLLHNTTLGVSLAQHEILCRWLSFGVIVMQCSFIAFPFYKKSKYVLLPAGFIFHTTAWILLDAGGWFNPWWAMYLFFLFPLQPQETK